MNQNSFRDYAYNVNEGMEITVDGKRVLVDDVRYNTRGTWISFNNDTSSRFYEFHEMVEIYF